MHLRSSYAMTRSMKGSRLSRLFNRKAKRTGEEVHHEPPRVTFFSLPPEIRYMIYKYCDLRAPLRYGSGGSMTLPYWAYVPLLNTHPVIRAEALPVRLHQNLILLNELADETSLEKILAYCDPAGKNFWPHIRAACMRFCGKSMIDATAMSQAFTPIRQILRSCTNLEEIFINLNSCPSAPSFLNDIVLPELESLHALKGVFMQFATFWGNHRDSTYWSAEAMSKVEDTWATTLSGRDGRKRVIVTVGHSYAYNLEPRIELPRPR